MSEKINCFKCKFYYTTWDPRFPRGCKFFGFKTIKMPSQSVYEASGKTCLNFTIKQQ